MLGSRNFTFACFTVSCRALETRTLHSHKLIMVVIEALDPTSLEEGSIIVASPEMEEQIEATENKKNVDEPAPIKSIRATLAASGIQNYSVDKDRHAPDTVFNFNLTLENDRYSCVFIQKADPNHLIITISTSARIPQAKREVAAVYLSHVNFGMSLGNFELDMTDGEVRFKISGSFRGTVLPTEASTEMFGIGVAMAERVSRVFRQILTSLSFRL